MQATTENNALGATLLVVIIILGLVAGGFGYLVGGGIWAFTPVILVIMIFLVWFINGPGRGLLLGGTMILLTILVLWTLAFGAQALEGVSRAIESVVDRSIPETVTTTVYITDRSESTEIGAKYVAGQTFFGGVFSMFLVAIIAQAAVVWSRRALGFALVQVILSGGLIWFLAVMPWVGNYDSMTSSAANFIFGWAILGGTIWSYFIRMVITGRGIITSVFSRERLPSLVLGIVLAPTFILGSLNPNILMFGVLTNVVHTTALSMDQALLLWQEGLLVGAIGLPAAKQLWSLLGYLVENLFLWLETKGIR